MKKYSGRTDHTLVKDCIFTSLMMLMDQKKFEDITITEITQKAGVSRMTYYRLYNSKEDILIQHLSEVSRSLTQKLEKSSPIPPEQLYLQFFTLFQKHSSLIEHLAEANLLNLLLDHFMEVTHCLNENTWDPQENDEHTKYRLRFQSGGLFSMLLHWIETGQKESPEEMAKLAADIINV